MPRYKEILANVLDAQDNVEDSRDFESVKQAKAWVKETALDRSYWVRHSESNDYPEKIRTIQLVCDGDIIMDWFPAWGTCRPQPLKEGLIVDDKLCLMCLIHIEGPQATVRWAHLGTHEYSGMTAKVNDWKVSQDGREVDVKAEVYTGLWVKIDNIYEASKSLATLKKPGKNFEWSRTMLDTWINRATGEKRQAFAFEADCVGASD
jgi:hypothetical protein